MLTITQPFDPPPGYAYGRASVPTSPVSIDELGPLKSSVGWTADTQRYLLLAGEVLSDHVAEVVRHWRSGVIAGIPHLARHSRALDGAALPDYLARRNKRFEQWILDTCTRPYDQQWLDYQHEIALRHTSMKENQTDDAPSTAFVPFGDILAFSAVMNQTIRPFLAAKGHSTGDAGLQIAGNTWAKYPFEPGYAAISEVIDVGEGVEGFSRGQNVFDWGKHRSWSTADPAEEVVLPVPEMRDPRDALLARFAQIAATAVVRLSCVPRTVLVMGAGLIGILAARMFELAGSAQVLVQDKARPTGATAPAFM